MQEIEKPVKKEKNKQIILNFILFFIFLILFFGCFEVILRLSGFSTEDNLNLKKNEIIFNKSSNDKLIYELKPNLDIHSQGVIFKTNDIGLREDKNSTELLNLSKPVVVFLGDSVLAARYLNNSDTLPRKLEEMSNYNVSAINLGVGGYGSQQEVEFLKEKKALQFKPEYVFVAYVLDDPLPSPTLKEHFVINETSSCKLEYLNLDVPCFLKNLGKEIRTFSFMYIRLKNSFESFRRNKLDYWTEIHQDDSYENVRSSFEELQELSQKNNFKVYVIIFPVLRYNETYYKWTGIHERVREDAEARGFGVIDLYDEYKYYSPEELKIAKSDLIHPNKFGIQIAAEYIYSAVFGKKSSQYLDSEFFSKTPIPTNAGGWQENR